MWPAGLYELNVDERGRRCGTMAAYLPPCVRARPNLTVMCEATATRLLFSQGHDGGHAHVSSGSGSGSGSAQAPVAEGVEFTTVGKGNARDDEDGSQLLAALAREEVVLCGGTFHTPQLLMLSGIGPRDALTELGIEVVQELPGVGENLQDHLDIPVSVANPSREALGLSPSAIPMLLASPFKWLYDGTGPLGTNGVNAGGYCFSDALDDEVNTSIEYEDLQLHFFPGSLRDYNPSSLLGHQFALNVYLSRPYSRGRLWLSSTDPSAKPCFVLNSLQDTRDQTALCNGVRIARRILESPSLAQYRSEELEPGTQCISDADILAYLRESTKSAHHPVGTCKMGKMEDTHAVLTADLKVIGVDRLRVADASAFPTITTSNPNSSVIAMAERCADLLVGVPTR